MSANDLADLIARAERLVEGYPEDVFPPLTDTVRDVVLSSGEHVPVDRVSAHALRVVALPVIADLVAALRVQAEQLDTLRSGAWPVRVESLRIIAAWADAYVPSHGDALRSIADGLARLLAAAGGGVPEEGATDEQ